MWGRRNGGLVVSGAPGNRAQYADNFAISDWVPATGIRGPRGPRAGSAAREAPEERGGEVSDNVGDGVDRAVLARPFVRRRLGGLLRGRGRLLAG
ncbi:hypothetical protein E1284_23900, partial [Actinomadura bangladeshensis]